MEINRVNNLIIWMWITLLIVDVIITITFPSVWNGIITGFAIGMLVGIMMKKSSDNLVDSYKKLFRLGNDLIEKQHRRITELVTTLECTPKKRGRPRKSK